MHPCAYVFAMACQRSNSTRPDRLRTATHHSSHPQAIRHSRYREMHTRTRTNAHTCIPIHTRAYYTYHTYHTYYIVRNEPYMPYITPYIHACLHSCLYVHASCALVVLPLACDALDVLTTVIYAYVCMYYVCKVSPIRLPAPAATTAAGRSTTGTSAASAAAATGGRVVCSVHAYVYVCMHVCMHSLMFVCMDAFINACLHAHVHVQKCMPDICTYVPALSA